jgi:hypothetical protein
MPFGIPCPDDDLPEMAAQLDGNNTRLQNLVYNIVFPIGQAITLNEMVFGKIGQAAKRRLKSMLGATETKIVSVLDGVASLVNGSLNTNACTLGVTQSAIALLPSRETPDIPAADVRAPAWPPPGGNTAVIVADAVREANADVANLLQLLYLLGVTPQQVRRYLERGTIPDIYLCPNTDAHRPVEFAPPPDIVQTIPSELAAPAVMGGLIADMPVKGLWEE